MVQRKDEAKHRVNEMADFLADERARLEENTIRFRWAVNEHTPEYDYGDGWSHPIPAKNNIVSPWFDVEEAAKLWLDQHEPDKGNTLAVVRERLLKREYTEWVRY
jgi:hypothetical protein